jgi:hypothetical protein
MSNLPEKQKPNLMQMISAGASKTEIIRQCGQLSLERILNEQPTSIARLRAQYGEKAERALAVLVLEASTAFDEAFSKETAIEAATELSISYGALSLEDFYLMLSQLKKSKLYGKLTVNKLLNAAEEYFENRCKTAVQRSYNAHLALKESPNEERTSTEIVVDKAFEKFKLTYHANKDKK